MKFAVTIKPRSAFEYKLLPDIPVDECTFCITLSFTAEGYTESTLMHR